MSLSTAYRPPNLDDVYGNTTEIEKLKSVLNREEDKPHTLLFKGPRGCGKTTLARIAAKMVGCHEADILEMDVATNRGIDSAKELKSSVMYRPLFGKSKAYILDEVHQGTPAFFNALLKTLEEPPDHVYFFLCTTDPQKVLKTVLSRCMIFTVAPLNNNELFDLLVEVVEKEQADLTDEHLDLLVSKSEGIPREALMMLDSVIDLDADKIDTAIKEIKTQEKLAIDLCRALLQSRDWKTLMPILKNLKEEEETVRRIVLGYMNSVLLGGGKGLDTASFIIEEFSEPFFNSGKAGLTNACYMTTL